MKQIAFMEHCTKYDNWGNCTKYWSDNYVGGGFVPIVVLSLLLVFSIILNIIQSK